MDEIDLMCASLENAVGTIGGFCAGKAYVVDHQVRHVHKWLRPSYVPQLKPIFGLKQTVGRVVIG